MGKTYITTHYCSNCNKYFKIVGRPNPSFPDVCDNCKTTLVCKSVEKWGENDPNIKEEVTNICYGENPRYSVTLGVGENQIEQAMKLHPGTDFKRFGNSFRPLIRNRGHKLKVMKEAGYSEYPPDMFKGKDGRN